MSDQLLVHRYSTRSYVEKEMEFWQSNGTPILLTADFRLQG